MYYNLEEIQEHVAGHRDRIRSEVNASHTMQKRWSAQLGTILDWMGRRFIVWGHKLQSTPPKLQYR